MTENILIIDADNATVKSVVNQIKSDMRGGRKYDNYVGEFGVTKDNLSQHAAALARLVTPETAQKTDGKRTKYGNAVQAAGAGLRGALKRYLGDDESDSEPAVQALLTKAGFAATMDEVIAAWKSAQV